VIWISLLGAYLVGAVPFAMIIARAHGLDLRRVGSGNIGATNLGRHLGRKWGILCFVLDAFKGLAPMLWMGVIIRPAFLERGGQVTIFLWWWMAAGTLAVLGHVFPVYLRFRGGKGVSTSFGVALGLWPYFTLPALAALLIWAMVVRACAYISLASMVAAASFPLVLLILIAGIPSWSFAQLWPLLSVATAIPLLVVILHRSNIQRLRAGTEGRVAVGKRSPTRDGI
jgi:glycerol-3-phosphate acyltransferase PlsY